MSTNITDSRIIKHSSDDDVVLSVQGVSKKFCRSLKRSLFYGVQDIASELVGVRKENNQLRKDEFWALQDVSFELKRGESLGLVGANGSGKTTLLRIISGLIKPDRGSIKITGRVAPLIALGAGFNPILTGRENIYVNMSILGLSKEEIDNRFDEVVDFAEIGDAIDAPVQTYSSGMAARLGFACAIHTEPDILLIDEVLAVGDIRFKTKCYRKLAELKKNNTSFILVSHHSSTILNVCSYGIYLLAGRVIEKGNVVSIINKYDNSTFEKNSEFESNVFKSINNNLQNNDLKILGFSFKDFQGNIIKDLFSGQKVYLCIETISIKKIEDLNIFVVVKNASQNNELILHMSNFYDHKKMSINSGNYELRVKLDSLGLNPGTYCMNLFIKKGSLFILDGLELFYFNVCLLNNQTPKGLFYQSREWEIVEV